MPVTWTYSAPAADETIVNVSFTDGTITHDRSVNAVFTGGAYDAEATETRVAEVGAGVETKIALGVITESSEEPAPTPPG